MFIKVTNSDNKVCYANVANIQYVEHREETYTLGRTIAKSPTLAVIMFGDRSCIFTQESVDKIMKLIAKANKQTNK